MNVDIPLLRALISMREDGPHDRWQGICYNLARADDELYQILHVTCPPDYEFEDALKARQKELFMKWPEFSGVVTYPVVCPWGKPDDGYNSNTHHLWEGAYGNSRRALLDFMIKELQECQTPTS